MSNRIHAAAGTIALAIIVSFWSATAAVEIIGDGSGIALVKSSILFGMLALIPALAITGTTGMRLGRGRTNDTVQTKRRRMPFIAANGLLVLLPSAFFLAEKAQTGTFDTAFHAVQALELVAGAVNIILLGLNLRDGLRLRAGGSRHARATQR